MKRLVCIDSDGCAFDTMEIKHKECFCPSLIQMWGLQPISKYAREAWEFANLYSTDRGRSRFIDLVKVFDLLEDRADVQAYHFQFPDIQALRDWVATAPELTNAELAKSDDLVLQRTLAWSLDCNRRVAEMVHGVPPFPGVRESLEMLSKEADIIVVSATAREALEREWAEHDLMKYIHRLCGQEDGSKKQCIASAKGEYPAGNVLTIGDAPGDREAAKANDVLFYPIRPGQEIASWHEFLETDMQLFLAGKYTREREQNRVDCFMDCLPFTPPWKREISGDPLQMVQHSSRR